MKLRVLVVDDSKLMRRLISDILNADPALEVVAEAPDGPAAIRLIHELRPDAVTLDVEMPGMSGLEVLGYIMSEIPTPVVILSGMRTPDLAMQALALGAVDFMRKPSGTISVDLYKVKEELVNKVKAAPLANLRQLRQGVEQAPLGNGAPSPPTMAISSKDTPANWCVVIGASTGGPQALTPLLADLPAGLAAGFLLVQHMPAGFTRSLAQRLNKHCRLSVVEAEEGMPFQAGWVYVAPGGHHLVVQGGQDQAKASVHLDDSPPRGTLRPAVDVTMAAAAACFGTHTLGVILTGMGSDGAEGCREIRQVGGRTIAQDRHTSLIYGMPRVVAEQGLADQVLPLDGIAQAIAKIALEE
ncbi:MAG: chemotaxis response regulator protein-glutamate methylesterase [Thermoflexales bacterium]|nr:chemotaxis response regulator protein-glutamate methylesterase [Thermoflexales bacterium]